MAVATLSAIALGHVLSAFYLEHGLPDWAWLANTLDLLFQQATGVALVALLAVFPDGEYQRPYERWLVWIVALGAVAVVPLMLIASPSIPSDGIFLWSGLQPASPLRLSAADQLQPGLPLPVAAIIGVVLLALRALRFRGSGLDLRWAMLVVSLFCLLPVANGLVLLHLLSPSVSAALFMVIFPIVTASLAIGLLRFRLFDVELVIRRSVVYGVAWTAIALVYAALAAGFGLATALRYQVAVAILVTIAVTIAFQPARGWLEHLADRLVYGRRLEGYQIVKQLGAAFDRTLELEAIGPRLAQAVAGGLGATWVDVYVGREGAGAATFEKVGRSGPVGASGQPALTQPLTHAGELVGKIEVGPASAGGYRLQDRELLLAIAQQAALAIRNARLAAELAGSRARLVQAQEAERRRVERDLHDGIQQQLVSLMAGIRAARTQLSRDPAQAEDRLAALQEEAHQALKDLRRVVAGIHPAVLNDHGLATAVRARISRLPIDIEFECPEALAGQRFGEEVESAAYFLISEGLTNVLKHSGSMAAQVKLGSANGHLRVEVRDGGRGFNLKDAPVSGLQGLRDRVEALGGRLTVNSSPGAGTRLVATLKIRLASHA
jgi:signal transduction histidine kinase